MFSHLLHTSPGFSENVHDKSLWCSSVVIPPSPSSPLTCQRNIVFSCSLIFFLCYFALFLKGQVYYGVYRFYMHCESIPTWILFSYATPTPENTIVIKSVDVFYKCVCCFITYAEASVHWKMEKCYVFRERQAVDSSENKSTSAKPHANGTAILNGETIDENR